MTAETATSGQRGSPAQHSTHPSPTSQRDAHEEFVAWLDRNFGLGPPEDPEALWAERKPHDERFRAWASRFAALHDAC